MRYPDAQRRSRIVPWLLAVTPLAVVPLAVAPTAVAHAQGSLAPSSPSGQSVTPVFEGWYHNKDGSYSLSFGYYNRNTAEQMDVPIGNDNFVAPGAANQGQPSSFSPRRHWGVFAVVVPADFGSQQVVWTVKDRGQTFAIPGSLKPDWEIDAVEGEASSNNTPPSLRFADRGTEGRGPLGVTSSPLRIRVGTPLALSVTVTDDAKTKAPVDLTWFKHQGPGTVSFSAPTSRLTPTGGTGTTTATFSRAGEYLVRVRANDLSAMTAGHAQCCWTNGFIPVTVLP
ncbi:hypothetical protein [Gemmatimonas sp.]|uniref:hypothetical protein n=1 Tax=Gemmatimonas sp. TaxID=1962908 RepID=UPI003982F93E